MPETGVANKSNGNIEHILDQSRTESAGVNPGVNSNGNI